MPRQSVDTETHTEVETDTGVKVTRITYITTGIVCAVSIVVALVLWVVRLFSSS